MPPRNIIADSSDEEDDEEDTGPSPAPATIGAFKMKAGKKPPAAKVAPPPKAKAPPPPPPKAKAPPPKAKTPEAPMEEDDDDDALLAACEAAENVLPDILDDDDDDEVVESKPKAAVETYSVSVSEMSLRDALKAITFPGATKIKTNDDEPPELNGVVQVEVLRNAAIFDDKGAVTAAPPMKLLGYGATIQGMVQKPTFTGMLLHYNDFGVRSGTCAIECDVEGDVPDGGARVAHIESTDMLSELRAGRSGNVVLRFRGNTVGVVSARDADSGLHFCELVQVECESTDLPRRMLPVMFDADACPKRHATLTADGAWLYNELAKVVRNNRESHSIKVHSDGRWNRIVQVVTVTEGHTKRNLMAWVCLVGRHDVIELRKASASATKRHGEELGNAGKRRRGGEGIPVDVDDDMGLGTGGAPLLTFDDKPPAGPASGGGIPTEVEADPFAVAAEVERTKAKIAAMKQVYAMRIDMFSLLKVFESIRETVAKVWLHLFDGILIINARLFNGTLLVFGVQGKVDE